MAASSRSRWASGQESASNQRLSVAIRPADSNGTATRITSVLARVTSLAGDRVVDGVLDVPVLLEPERRSGVQPGNGVGIGGLELAPQDGREEMVVPVLGAGRVERDEEEVRALDLGEHRGGVGALEHGVAEGRRQSCRAPTSAAMKSRTSGSAVARTSRAR